MIDRQISIWKRELNTLSKRLPLPFTAADQSLCSSNENNNCAESFCVFLINAKFVKKSSNRYKKRFYTMIEVCIRPQIPEFKSGHVLSKEKCFCSQGDI